MKSRIDFIDNLKGILIILVVFAHFLIMYYTKSPFISIQVKLIYSFHMPLFIFISGLLSKNINKEKTTHLLIYYIIFNTIMMLYTHFFENKPLDLLNSYYSFWYIPSLIIMRLIIKKVGNIKGIIPISIIISLLSGFYNWHLTYIFKTLALFPFFLIGYKLDISKINNYTKNTNIKKIILSIISIILFIIIFILTEKYIGFTYNSITLDEYQKLTDIILRIIIFICSLLMLSTLINIIPNKKIPLISKWGKNSLTIYVLHRFITLITSYFLSNYSNKYYIYLILLTIITLIILGSNIITHIIEKLINIISNKKNIIIAIFIIFLLINIILNCVDYIKDQNLIKEIISIETIKK